MAEKGKHTAQEPADQEGKSKTLLQRLRVLLIVAVVVLVVAGVDTLLSLVLDNLPLVELPIQYAGLVCPVVLVWYIVTELGSMVENAVAMGALVPQ